MNLKISSILHFPKLFSFLFDYLTNAQYVFSSLIDSPIQPEYFTILSSTYEVILYRKVMGNVCRQLIAKI